MEKIDYEQINCTGQKKFENSHKMYGVTSAIKYYTLIN